MNRLAIGLLIILALTPACWAGESENIEVVKAMIETINNGDLASLDEFVAQDIVRHSAATPGVVVTNIDEFRAFLSGDLTTFPDAKQEIDIVFSSGNLVAIRARLIGTQTGPMGPFPASGKKMELPFMGILRVEDGKVAEIWVEWDNLNALGQLGHFPPAGQE